MVGFPEGEKFENMFSYFSAFDAEEYHDLEM